MSDGQSWDAEIELRKEPYRIKVGDVIYEFLPEVESERLLDSYRQLNKIRHQASSVTSTDGEPDPDALGALVQANKEYVASLMLPASSAAFLAQAPPDRAIVAMAQKLMEHYGGTARPTGPSSVSSDGLPTTGTRSTEPSRSRGSTRAAGGRSS